jgi:hypothetical protein
MRAGANCTLADLPTQPPKQGLAKRYELSESGELPAPEVAALDVRPLMRQAESQPGRSPEW